MTRFKICCIKDQKELAMAVAAGASAVGLVSAMPSGPGPIEEDQIGRLLERGRRGSRRSSSPASPGRTP